MPDSTVYEILSFTKKTNRLLKDLSFGDPVTHIYNPLEYAWEIHKQYISRFANSKKKILFLGMNPGPYGMAQTGVPFGEIDAVKNWMKLDGKVSQPINMHSKRPIEGLGCARSEVSGRRLWGLFSEKHKNPESFFEDNFVVNYCPLVFMEESGRNRTPDKLPASERALSDEICDNYLKQYIEVLSPEWVIGVGQYAEKKAEGVSSTIENSNIQIGRILHPSPASPAANRGWAEQAIMQLKDLNLWT